MPGSVMRIGDELRFKKFKWVVCKSRTSYPFGHRQYFYRVYRRYKLKKYRRPVYATNTSAMYPIFDWRWNFLRRKLKKNPDYHYTTSLWSGNKR